MQKTWLATAGIVALMACLALATAAIDAESLPLLILLIAIGVGMIAVIAWAYLV